MRLSRRSKDTWTQPTWQGLLGDFGKPIIPLWWAESLPQIQFTTYFVKKRDHDHRTCSLREEVQDPLLSTPGISINWEKTFTSIAINVEHHRDDFLDASIGDPSHIIGSSLLGSDLPLQISYVEKFAQIGLEDYSISEISAIPIQHFLENDFSWLEVADLSYVLSHGIGHIFGLLSSHEMNPIQNLEESATNIVDELWLRDGGRLDEQRLEIIKHRFGIGSRIETLDAIGSRLGVTRERVRQIESRFTKYYAERRWPISSSMKEVIEDIIDNDSSEILENVVDLDLSNGSIDWDRIMFVNLLQAYGRFDLINSISGLGEMLDLNSELVSAIRKHRSPIGFFDLRTFENDSGEFEHPDKVFKYVQQVYGNPVRSGDVALVGDARGTQAQGAVEKQFAVCSEISGHELVEGIDRVRRNRGYVPLPPASTVIDLLKQAGSILETKPGFYTGAAAEIDGDLKLFLVNAIRDSPGGVISQPELFRLAVSEGFNTSSLVLYLTYDPMIRKFEGGLIRLVGTIPSAESIEDAKRAGQLQTEKGTIDFTVGKNGSILVTCALGTTNLNSGVLSPSAALRAILDKDGYDIYCCSESNFNGRIKLSATLWYGFQPMFNHMRHDHSVVDGDVVSFVLSNGELRISSW